MKPPVHIVLHLARIAWLATEYGLIASLLIAAVTAMATSLGHVLVRLVKKGRRKSGRDRAPAQLVLS